MWPNLIGVHFKTFLVFCHSSTSVFLEVRLGNCKASKYDLSFTAAVMKPKSSSSGGARRPAYGSQVVIQVQAVCINKLNVSQRVGFQWLTCIRRFLCLSILLPVFLPKALTVTFFLCPDDN